MPLEQTPQVPLIKVSTITEDELRQPGATKLLYRRVTELMTENQDLRLQLGAQSVGREQAAALLHDVDAKRQVLEERLALFRNRNAVSQLIWGALAVVLSFFMDAAKSGRWIEVLLYTSVIVFLGCAVYLVNKTPKDRAASGQANTVVG